MSYSNILPSNSGFQGLKKPSFNLASVQADTVVADNIGFSNAVSGTLVGYAPNNFTSLGTTPHLFNKDSGLAPATGANLANALVLPVGAKIDSVLVNGNGSVISNTPTFTVRLDANPAVSVGPVLSVADATTFNNTSGVFVADAGASFGGAGATGVWASAANQYLSFVPSAQPASGDLKVMVNYTLLV